MIPDFKTYIGESVWNDIRRRGNGTDVKKEDDVDFLEPQAFVEYLRNLYKNIDTEFYIFKDLNDIITVPTFETDLGTKSTWFIEYDCNKKAVYIWEHFLNKEDKLFDKLNDDYKLTFIRRNSTENFLVEPKKGKSSNKFFIEIIDYILENASDLCKRILVKNDKLSESVWNDIRRRGIGADVKKEDDVNLLDRDGFYEYLINHYNTYENSSDIYTIRNSEAADTINIPFIETYDNKIYRVIMWNFDKDKMISSRPYITIPYHLGIFDGGKLFRKMSKEYILKELMDDRFNPRYEILPKGIVKKTEINNKFFLGVIDFIIDNIEDKNTLLINKK